MRTLLIASVLLGFGCGGGTEGDLAKYRDKMCDCPDKACTEKVFEDYREWAKGARQEAKKMSKDERARMDLIDGQLKECRRKFRDEGKGSAAAPTGSGSAAPTTP